MGNIGDEKCYLYGSCKCQTAGCVVRPDNGCPVYRYFKNLIVKDYENRLKADMAAMLTDFLMDIEENTSINSDDSHERNGKRLMRTEIIGMFEQKIDKLKESTDGNK